MKKIISLFMIFVLLACMLLGCSEKRESNSNTKEPDIFQIRNICNLATLDCYYHNVAKSVKKAGSGISHFGEKDRTFWIEYTGVAKLGIDMSKVKMKIDGTDIELSIPEAEVLSVTIDKQTLDEDSYISSEDGINSNKITADDQIQAINSAQLEMEKNVKQNSALLLSAQNRAKTLIENYINQLGKASEIEYNINWIYEEKRDVESIETVREMESN